MQRQIISSRSVKAAVSGGRAWQTPLVEPASHSASSWRRRLSAQPLGLFGMARHQVLVDQLTQFELDGVLKR